MPERLIHSMNIKDLRRFEKMYDKRKIIFVLLLTLSISSFCVFQYAERGLHALNRNLVGLEILRGLVTNSLVEEHRIEVFSRGHCQKYWLLGLIEQSAQNKENVWQNSLRCSQQYMTAIQSRLPDSKILANISVQLYPSLAKSWFWLAELNKTDQTSTSIELYLKGLLLEPNNGVALYHLAEIYEADGQYVPAIESYIKSCDYLNEGSDCYVRVGRIMELLGDSQSAIYYYRLSIDPNAHNHADELER